MVSSTESKQLINLVRGWPSTTLLPTAAISHAAQSVLADTTVAYPGLLYGPDEGYKPLRDAIAAWNTSFYQPKNAITNERITITGGASQNLGCMLQVFTDPIYTRKIWFVAPSYMLAFRVFQDNGFAGKMRAIREDDQGLDVDSLRQEMQKCEDEKSPSSNEEPVRLAVSVSDEPHRLILVFDVDSQTSQAVRQGLSPYHILCSDFCKSVVQDNDT